MKLKIPRCMSTQHPDNATLPFFSDSYVIEGETEIKEAYYAYSHLGVEEQLWDCEGKEADYFVVEKLLSRYEDFFRKHLLGKDVFLTVRIPNPSVQKNEGKILLEMMESIPRNFDIAQAFYHNGTAPISEVYLPMTSSASELERVRQYYKYFVAGKQNTLLHDTTIAKWIGSFKPDEIMVTPLIEDWSHMLNSDKIMRDYLHGKRYEYHRVWLARSDPAVNYGNISAVMLNKIALQRLFNLEEELSIELYPIIGVGACPFRGNLRPVNVRNCLKGYPSIQTFTVQSAFKYDYEESIVKDAVDTIKETKRKRPVAVDEKKLMAIMRKASRAYKQQLMQVFPIVQDISPHIPRRRKRKLHIGLYGYSRQINGLSLPRAITFCASLYSVGIAPELLGLSALGGNEMDEVRKAYPSFDADIEYALSYVNAENFRLLPKQLARKLKSVMKKFNYETDEKHNAITTKIANDAALTNPKGIDEYIVEAARLRGFLG